jgi:hypothetical protein
MLLGRQEDYPIAGGMSGEEVYKEPFQFSTSTKQLALMILAITLVFLILGVLVMDK